MDEFFVSQTIPEEQPTARTVTVGGAMTIRHGLEIKEALKDAMAAGESLVIDLQGVTEIDLIGMQVICATHRSFMAQGRQLSVVRAGNQAIDTVVRTGGFARHTGCVQDTCHTCVWIGKEA